MIITIDGPAGTGKSTVSKLFADKIHYQVLSTGAMYRCVALLKKNSTHSLDDQLLQQDIIDMDIEFSDNKVFLNKKDVSELIITPEIDLLTSQISTHYFVRQKMCDLQRQFAQGKNIVAEGRDMGSNVFPHAELKFYLTADSLVRAKRRQNQLKAKGIDKSIDELKREIEQRDYDDMNREINPLCVPHNAVMIDTGDITLEEVLQRMLDSYHSI